MSRTIVPEVRLANPDWFCLADDLNGVLQQFADSAVAEVKGTYWASPCVGVRILLRGSENVDSALVLAERGKIADSRAIVRTLLEAAFGMAALVKDPGAYIDLLKKDSEASRQRQRKFLLAEGLISDPAKRASIDLISRTVGKQVMLDVKAVAKLSPLIAQYLVYQRLSDGAGHVSARSLDHHAERSAEGWTYRCGVADPQSTATTLHALVYAGLSLGIAGSELLRAEGVNGRLVDLAERAKYMPLVGTI